MKRLILAMICLALFAWAGCSSDSAEDTSQDQVAEAPVERVLDPNAPVLMKPSGVRTQDLWVGQGKEVVDSMYVKFEYDVFFADTSGLLKGRRFNSSKMTLQPYLGQVGVTPVEGLSDGLIGMHVGGARRIFVPKDLGYGDKPPFGGTNLIFEIDEIQQVSAADVNQYQDEYNNPENIKAPEPEHDSGGGAY